MKLIKPFCGLRPTRALASQVASHPYDVLNRKEATEIAKDNPYSFLHINKPEIDLDRKTEAYNRRVYQKAGKILTSLLNKGSFSWMKKPITTFTNR